MAEDTWEIDVEQLTLNDLEMLQKGALVRSDATTLKDLLGRLVTNKTAEEIGAIPLRQLLKHLEQIGRTVDELAIPKENATP